MSQPEEHDVERPLLLEEYDQATDTIVTVDSSDTPVLPRKGQSINQGAISIVNIILGIGILSMPYAMHMSGWIGIVAVLLCSLLFCWSGKLLAYALEHIPPGKVQSYPQLGFEAFGPHGRTLVMVLAIMELFGSCCLFMIVMWRELERIVPGRFVRATGFSANALVTIITIMIEVPLCCAGTFKQLNVFSALGCTTTLVVTTLIIGLAVLDPDHRDIEPTTHTIIGTQMLPATGIFALSVAGHSCFPSVRNSLAKPSEFHSSLHRAYALTAVIVTSISGVGYWYWGDQVHQLVTTDFEVHSPYVGYYIGPRGFNIATTLESLVLLNLITTLPMFVLSLQDILCSSMVPVFTSDERRTRTFVETATRLALFFGAVLVSYKLADVLDDVESMVGAMCSIFCSLFMPAVFYAAMKYNAGCMTLSRWLGAGSMVLLGGLLLVLIVAKDASLIIRHFSGRPS